MSKLKHSPAKKTAPVAKVKAGAKKTAAKKKKEVKKVTAAKPVKKAATAGRIKPESKAALVIGTYAAVPYIHLHLESRKRYYPHIPVLIHDDSSHKSEQLKELCKQYGADFISTKERSVQQLGDINAFVAGLKWAKKSGREILVKMSRRFIPVTDWSKELDQLEKTGHHTFSNITRTYNYGFRTECLGMRVSEWKKLIPRIEKMLANKQAVFVEGYIHDLARELNETNPVAKKWDEENNRSAEVNAYAVWDFMGDDRHTRYPQYLWHNAFHPEDYKQLSDAYGLGYSTADFYDPNEGGGIM